MSLLSNKIEVRWFGAEPLGFRGFAFSFFLPVEQRMLYVVYIQTLMALGSLISLSQKRSSVLTHWKKKKSVKPQLFWPSHTLTTFKKHHMGMADSFFFSLFVSSPSLSFLSFPSILNSQITLPIKGKIFINKFKTLSTDYLVIVNLLSNIHLVVLYLLFVSLKIHKICLIWQNLIIFK